MDGLEDNIVGNLFTQNGEDNGYNPEDFVQEINVGDMVPTFRISVANDDGGIPGSLFACTVWNGAKCIASHFAKYSDLVQGRNIVEFGAASALPSLVALHFGAKLAVMTANIQRNQTLLGNGRHEVCGHLWGSDTARLLGCLDKSFVTTAKSSGAGPESNDVLIETKFDIAVVAECLWLHHLHEDLLKSIDSCLTRNGKAFVSFAHHVPGHEQNDLSFFAKAKKLYGFDAVHLDTLATPHVFSAGLVVEQYLYVLTRSI
ncbi:unnamed protein product [Peronospora belbahrii]|uniref:Calmodulin-lysine N-methyltransferase n=1 Tax=Peronospora belbahrii TaxID=622444 RepID=A0AAU9KUL6_9STRA|nr:unnamed protein product [Peronospora belbahrii]